MIETSWSSISPQNIASFPLNILIKTLYTQDELCNYAARVALEEPLIQSHHQDCHDIVSYNEDWHALWWNLVRTALLNGRNPTTYLEAIRRLQNARDLGRMNQACFNDGVIVAETAEGWGHHYKLIERVSDESEESIVKDNGMNGQRNHYVIRQSICLMFTVFTSSIQQCLGGLEGLITHRVHVLDSDVTSCATVAELGWS